MPLWHKDGFEGNGEKANTGRTLSPLPLCLKAGGKFPFVKMFPSPSPIPEGGEQPLSPEMESQHQDESAHTSLTKITLIFY